MSDKPTIGYLESTPADFDRVPIMEFLRLKKFDNQDYILTKRHSFDDFCNDADKLIVIVRDYKECIPRHIQHLPKTLDNFIGEAKGIEREIDYLGILKDYEVFEGDKLLIHYEDFITKPKETLRETIKFLGYYRKDRLDELIENFEEHKNNGIKSYTSGSQTKGKSLKFHSRKIPKTTLDEFTNHFKSEAPEIFEKYLKRYE